MYVIAKHLTPKQVKAHVGIQREHQLLLLGVSLNWRFSETRIEANAFYVNMSLIYQVIYS